MPLQQKWLSSTQNRRILVSDDETPYAMIPLGGFAEDHCSPLIASMTICAMAVITDSIAGGGDINGFALHCHSARIKGLRSHISSSAQLQHTLDCLWSLTKHNKVQSITEHSIQLLCQRSAGRWWRLLDEQLWRCSVGGNAVLTGQGRQEPAEEQHSVPLEF